MGNLISLKELKDSLDMIETMDELYGYDKDVPLIFSFDTFSDSDFLKEVEKLNLSHLFEKLEELVTLEINKREKSLLKDWIPENKTEFMKRN